MRINLKDFYDNCSVKDKISYAQYNTILKKIGLLIVEEVIRGNRVKVPGISFYIRSLSNDFSKLLIDWGATNKKKKELEEKGFTVKSKENPDGVPYHIYYTNNVFYRWAIMMVGVSGSRNYVKTGTRVYKFEPSRLAARTLAAQVKKQDFTTLMRYDNY